MNNISFGPGKLSMSDASDGRVILDNIKFTEVSLIEPEKALDPNCKVFGLDRRVAYLMKHSRKLRTRKKNFNRAWDLIKKENKI